MGFFRRGYEIGYGETIHLLHSTYSIDFCLRTQIRQINKLLDSAQQQQGTALVMDLWKSLYPYMRLGWHKVISYTEFKDQLVSAKKVVSEKTAEEVTEEISGVIAQYEASRKHL